MIGPFAADDDATPIASEERDGLIPTHVSLRKELNELEQKNIAKAALWAFARKRPILEEPFLRGLHRRMFDDVWRWAGKYRTSERNLGIDAYRIQPELHQILGDARFWIEHSTYTADEIAVRFHHKLVLVHPFPNGNGRWSRLMGDLLAMRLGGERFTWGSANLEAILGVRRTYIDALRAADAHDIEPLLQFARS
jgi:Fic-DOC domain mobile mystery protein B